MVRTSCVVGLLSAALIANMALGAEATDEFLSPIVVTATRIPEPLDRIPADISVVSGQELRARGAWDMATSLSLVPGVEAPPGGDAGPSSAVPAFWGLHEFDAFLLVVDEVPWGGAFNPGITTLDFTVNYVVLGELATAAGLSAFELVAGPLFYLPTKRPGIISAFPTGTLISRWCCRCGRMRRRRQLIGEDLRSVVRWPRRSPIAPSRRS